METDTTTDPKLTFEASCFCGAASWKLEGKPLSSVYCHCTRCQRRTGSPFIHSLHFPTTSFTWTHQNPNAVFNLQVASPLTPTTPWSAYWCQTCHTFIGASNTTLNLWTLKSVHFARDPTTGLIINFDKLKPTSHVFYGTRVLDVPDGLPKWEGYSNKSKKLDLP